VIEGALAAVAGVFVGLTVQIRPLMGADLLFPSSRRDPRRDRSVYGALLGGLVVGLAEALAVPWSAPSTGRPSPSSSSLASPDPPERAVGEREDGA